MAMSVNLKKYPDHKGLSSISIGSLSGGLNIDKDPADLASGQSPDMLNMWYKDGSLRRRSGIQMLRDGDGAGESRCLWYNRLYNGYMVWIDGVYIMYANPSDLSNARAIQGAIVSVDSGYGSFIPFEEYLFYKGNGVYIKIQIDDNTKIPKAEYILRKDLDGTYAIGNSYVPIISINRNPDGTGGDAYQPENRINPDKTVWIDADKKSTDYYLPVHGVDQIVKVQIDDDTATVKSYDASTDTYTWIQPNGFESPECIIGGRKVDIVNGRVSDDSSMYTYLHLSAPMEIDESYWGTVNCNYVKTQILNESAANIKCSTMDLAYDGTTFFSKNSDDPAVADYSSYVTTAMYRARKAMSESNVYREYTLTGDYIVAKDPTETFLSVRLPTRKLDNSERFRITGYDASTNKFSAMGHVHQTFYLKEQASGTTDADALALTTPLSLANRVRVTYRKSNPDALKAIADCSIAIDYGGSDSVCIVMANCSAQPNAMFWSGNGSAGVDPTYFPMDQYNLVGTYQDEITALAKYQSFLIILQGHQTSRGSYSIESNSATGRNFIDIAVSTINPERGCDCPRSVQLCGNNLVWVHSAHGVMYLNDTSWANENAIIRISDNINGSKYRPGLLTDLADADKKAGLNTADDGERYYIFIGDTMWCWHYTIGSLSDGGVSSMSWSKHSGFDIQSAATMDTDTLYMLDRKGNVVKLSDDEWLDYGEEEIKCHWTCATQTLGGYYNKKDVTRLILSLSSEYGGDCIVRYGAERNANVAKEMYTELKSSMRIDVPKREFPHPVVLRPRLLHVQHMYFRIESDGHDGGLALDNALILYRSMGVTK